MTANMSAATPVLLGSTRLSIAAVATAASIALPPSRMICRPACAASGWLVVTMPRGAITSARLCAAQPSARSPRTAEQAAASGGVLQADIGGPNCAIAGTEAATRIAEMAQLRTAPMRFSRMAVLEADNIPEFRADVAQRSRLLQPCGNLVEPGLGANRVTLAAGNAIEVLRARHADRADN